MGRQRLLYLVLSILIIPQHIVKSSRKGLAKVSFGLLFFLVFCLAGRLKKTERLWINNFLWTTALLYL
jgi:hypothetical protein